MQQQPVIRWLAHTMTLFSALGPTQSTYISSLLMHYGVLASPAATVAAGVFRVTIKNPYHGERKIRASSAARIRELL
jgi:hypothetical protein